MAFKNFIEILGKTGNPEDRVFSRLVEAQLQFRQKDIPLQEKGRIQIVEFTDIQKKRLKDRGYRIFPLTGQSLNTLQESGHNIDNNWRVEDPLREEPSILSEVAVNPKSLFLSDSHGKTWEENFELVKIFKGQLSKEICGITVIMGTAPDYLELASLYPSQTHQELFNRDNRMQYTDTTTRMGEFYLVFVGNDNNDGLSIYRWHRDTSRFYIGVIPLVVPTAAVSQR